MAAMMRQWGQRVAEAWATAMGGRRGTREIANCDFRPEEGRGEES